MTQPPIRLGQLKRDAKKLKKRAAAEGRSVKHHEALKEVARSHGFRDYRHARAELQPDDESEY